MTETSTAEQTATHRGQSYKINKERPRFEVRKHSFFFRVMDPCNSLPNLVVEAPTVETSGTRLDRGEDIHNLYDIKATTKKFFTITSWSLIGLDQPEEDL